jgi:hypothetical protein
VCDEGGVQLSVTGVPAQPVQIGNVQKPQPGEPSLQNGLHLRRKNRLNQQTGCRPIAQTPRNRLKIHPHQAAAGPNPIFITRGLHVPRQPIQRLLTRPDEIQARVAGASRAPLRPQQQLREG